MPKYKYTAKDLNEGVSTGIAVASDVATLLHNLRMENKFLIKYKVLSEKNETIYKLKAKELAEFARELSVMLSAGIMVVKAVSILKNRDINKKLKAVYDTLYQSIAVGNTLSTAMQNCGTAFPFLMINMFAAGEKSSQLANSAAKMAKYYEKEYRVQNKIKSAATYPILLLCITILVIMLVFTVILPQFFKLLEGVKLPLITQIVMGFSHFIINYWYILLIIILIIIALLSYIIKKPEVRLRIDHMKLNLPLIKKPLKTIYTARFAQSLSSLYSSGLPLIEAVKISAKLLNNTYISVQFDAVAVAIRNGESLSSSVNRVDGFDNQLISTITIGEETGKLGMMLESMADSFDYEGEMAINRLITLMEPIMIVIMAVIVGSVILSVLLPILTMYKNIG